jgi:hypothetical protein
MNSKSLRIVIISIIVLFILGIGFFIYNNKYTLGTFLYNKNETVALNYLIILKKFSFKDSLPEDLKHYLSKINSEGVTDYELIQTIDLAEKIGTVIFENKAIEENISSDLSSTVIDLIFLDTTEIKKYYKYFKNLYEIDDTLQSFKKRNEIIFKRYSSMRLLAKNLNESTVNFYLINGKLPLNLFNGI